MNQFHLNIEVQLKSKSPVKYKDVIDSISVYLKEETTHRVLIERCKSHMTMNDNGNLESFQWDVDQLPMNISKHVDRVDIFPVCRVVESSVEIEFNIHVYKLSKEKSSDEVSQDQDESSPFQQWILPNQEFGTLWESLAFDDSLKSQLLDYISTLLLFGRFQIDSNIITNNRILFLYGPPGTGKTSLAKALAQKISVRFQNQFKDSFQLFEINSHSLFSKWFSESGKLVMKLFQRIREQLEDQNSFLVLLIDEVESLTSARKSALQGNEPSDAIRVVNAFLTQLDQLKLYKNILIISTSNLPQAVDDAFIDRADWKQYIGPPSIKARDYIFSSIINELQQKQFIQPSTTNILMETDDQSNSKAITIQELIKLTDAHSGRFLRKLPFLAISKCISSGYTPPIPYNEFLKSLHICILNNKIKEEFGK
ncbi:AAA ATPase domain-containing protein [Tieghemostelium lacteum]|uniref:AAA ATPase domain-containing protein n=1 Tax=Tieghemostelium lacteum TaxID=361077 RepID=A0A151ZAB8_TIELA|nr:AAA ATPase domain-containing protein [Tieghemostelium lacteum]|eukprot:KYQ90892.1 AAA ATPase domain-containing protein [Tieghemostelium lacteum]